jgi:hypothetical protein
MPIIHNARLGLLIVPQWTLLNRPAGLKISRKP